MVNDNILVSVIIPTYSRPEFLSRAVDSVLNQTHRNIEVIIVDDNDPDSRYRTETELLMQRYKDNSRVTYLKHSKNSGGSTARNTGWKHSSGKYITFLDDDDEIVPDKIKEQVNCLEGLDGSWGMCYTAYELQKPDGTKQSSSEKRSGKCYIEALMRTLFMGSGSNLLLRKSVVDEIGGYDESFVRNQDIEFLARATEHYKIAYIDKNLLIIHQEQGRVKRSFKDIEDVTKHYLNKFDERIQALPESDRKRVILVISLERFRQALYAHELTEGIKILRENHVPVIYVSRFLLYLAKRVFTHRSYGFDGVHI